MAEAELQGVTKNRHNVLTNSGTTALHLALASLNIGRDDEVIVPTFTFIAPVNAVKYVSASPVFVDVEYSSLGMNIRDIKNKVTKKTKAIIYVHLFGITKDLTELKKFCDDRGIYLIEDVAEALLGSANGKFAGEYGHLAIYSFYGNKIVTSGEGGAVATNNANLAAKIRILKNHGMSTSNKYFFEQLGYNYRMTNVSAAILCAQIYRLSAMVKKRNYLFESYDKVLLNFTKFKSIEKREGLIISPWLYPLICHTKEICDGVTQDLKKLGIETRPFFVPIHTLPMYQDTKNHNLQKSIDLSSRGLCLPTSSAFSTRENKYLMKSLKMVLQKYE